MSENEFLQECEKLRLNLTTNQIKQLDFYADFLLDYNTHTNLTALKTKEDVYLKHFYDSLTLLNIYQFQDKEIVLDIGSGAGFPGLVLAISFPNIHVTLLDSNHKKIDFLNNVIEKLELKNVNTVHARSEEFTSQHLEMFDVITARAVAELRILLEISIPALKINGVFLAMKSNVQDELQKSNDTIDLLNAKIIEQKEFLLPIENSKRTLLKIKKVAKTPKGYPRIYGLILKKALKKNNK